MGEGTGQASDGQAMKASDGDGVMAMGSDLHSWCSFVWPTRFAITLMVEK